MKLAVWYDSATGNTEYLARQLAEALPGASCAPAERGEDGELICLGFWTDKGTCSDRLKAQLPRLAGKRVFLFGTAGFGGSEEYFSAIARRVAAELPEDCRVEGWYLCPGRMGEGVRRRYEAMARDPATREQGERMLENFRAAQSHPDEADARALIQRVRELLGE